MIPVIALVRRRVDSILDLCLVKSDGVQTATGTHRYTGEIYSLLYATSWKRITIATR